MNAKILAGAILGFSLVVSAVVALTHRPGLAPAASPGISGPAAPPKALARQPLGD